MEGIGAEGPLPCSPSAQALGGKEADSKKPATGCSTDSPLEALLSGAESGDTVHSGTPGDIELKLKTPQGGGLKDFQGYSSLEECPSV